MQGTIRRYSRVLSRGGILEGVGKDIAIWKSAESGSKKELSG